jgi:Cof subfamily protein (haloacid dehalogenase superfamily)
VRLVCLDVDGTLVGTSTGVRPAVWDALDRARDAGLRLALCSGRPGFGLTRTLAARDDAQGWHCFQNGASVVHLGGERPRSSVLPDETVAMLVARARAERLALELYTDDDYAVEHDAELARTNARLLGLDYALRPFESLRGPIVRAQWLLWEHEAEPVLAAPHPGLEVSPSTAPSVPGGLFVNLTRAGTDKGSAVRTIADAYGVALSEVMYVGDGFNDTPALRIVGYPVAMANAEPPALALAGRVVPHVDEDGVVEALALALASAGERGRVG